ncbi:MAG: PEP-CTERM sorting domain-containing protein [Isosphaeraceae bacterium]
MNTMARRLALVTAIFWFGLGAGGQAEAGAMLQTPSVLSPGAHFRFAIVTDGGTTATSSNIADYNSFVNIQAGGATYNGSVVTWSAIASTAADSGSGTPSTAAGNLIGSSSTSGVNAIDNVGQSQDPVYLVNGTQVTTFTTTSGLWSGTLLHSIDVDVSGKVTTASEVWTGTNPDGTGTLGFTLGSPDLAEVGLSGVSDSTWVAFGPDSVGTRHVLYGISQDLIASGSVIPEPASLWLLGTACAAGLAYGWSRRRRDWR